MQYKHLKSIRLWKLNARDDGLKPIVEYIKKNQQVQKLDLLDNNITERGCTFLQEIATIESPLLNLKLDHNLFGTRGL